MRFRDFAISFKVSDKAEEIDQDKQQGTSYPKMHKILGDFELTVEPGSFCTSEIIVLLGENGTGKTTLVKILAGKDKELKK